MSDLPLISVVTPVFNGEKTIARTIESLLRQTYPRVEYIIMDGGSSDRTVAVAESYRAVFAERGYLYRIVSGKDSGMYDALNRGVALATGDIIGQINADDDYELDALATVADTYRDTPFTFFYADLRVVKPDKSFIKKAKFTRFATTRHWNHPTTFIRADIYKSHPYVLASMYDDFDLILRLRRKGYRPVICNKPLANFHFGGMSTRKNLREVRHRIACRRANYKRNGYGFIYTIDSALTEFAKFLWG